MATIVLVPIWLMAGIAAWATFVVCGFRFESVTEPPLTEIYVRACMTSAAVLTSGRELNN